VICAVVGKLRRPSELIMICQNQSQMFDMMVVKWAVRGSGNNGTEMGCCGKFKQWY